jgi:hypothetical protein
MAPDSVLYSAPQSQGLIRYLSEASDISRANFKLQQLGREANARYGLFKLVQRWVMAYAQDRKQLPVQAPFKHEFYSLVEELADARGHMWALEIVSEYQQTRPALPPAPNEDHRPPPTGNAPCDVTALDPFLRSRQESNAIRRQQTVTERKKWALYYARYGCHRCDGKDKPHESNGLCANCHRIIVTRLNGLVEGKRKYGEFGV